MSWWTSWKAIKPTYNQNIINTSPNSTNGQKYLVHGLHGLGPFGPPLHPPHMQCWFVWGRQRLARRMDFSFLVRLSFQHCKLGGCGGIGMGRGIRFAGICWRSRHHDIFNRGGCRHFVRSTTSTAIDNEPAPFFSGDRWEFAGRIYRPSVGQKGSLPVPTGTRKPVETNRNRCGNRTQLLETVETGHLL